jgi:hypothetical protein
VHTVHFLEQCELNGPILDRDQPKPPQSLSVPFHLLRRRRKRVEEEEQQEEKEVGEGITEGYIKILATR